MATSVASKPVTLPRSVNDRAFFSGMAIGLAVTVFIGFARTYYLSAAFGTSTTTSGRPFSNIIRLHAALFTTWVVLFIVQTSLVATHRVAVHRRLGVAVAILAGIMVMAGTATAMQMVLQGGAPPGIAPVVFLAIPLGDMVVFTILITSALLLRRNKEAHKRLMLLAYTAIIVAAVARFPGVLPLGPLGFFGLTFLPVLSIAITYDLVTRGRIHPAYLWGGALLVVSVPVRLMISTTHVWASVAERLMSVARQLHLG
jgi:hypothetical protein